MMDRKVETREVKKALISGGFKNVRVGHGTGTAWGWLHIHVDAIKPPEGCYCTRETYGVINRCPLCSARYRENSNKAVSIAQSVTGRHGEYDGRINTYIEFDKQFENNIPVKGN